MSLTESPQDSAAPSNSNKWITLGIICLGNFLASISSSSMNLATPALSTAFAVDLNQVQWVITISSLVTSSVMLLFGRVGDRIGSSKLYNSGLVVYILASFMCGISGSFPILLTARVIQAIGASMTTATGVGILVTTFPATQRGKAIGIQAIAIGAGFMCGPSIGGLILDNLGWSYVFYLNIPLALIGLIGGLKYLRSPGPIDKSKLPRLDGVGALLLAVLICSLIIVLSGDISGSIWFLIPIVVALPCFILHERRHTSPLWDLNLLRNKRFALGNIVIFLIFTAHFSVLFHMPIYMNRMLNMPATTVGLLMLSSPAMMLVASPISGFITDKFGTLRVMPFAIVAVLAAQICFAFLQSDSSFWHVLIGMVLLGIGMGTLTPPADTEVMSSAGPENSGYAGGFLNTSRNLAICVGTAASAGAFTLLRNGFERSQEATVAYMSAFRIVFIAICAITCIGLFVCLRLARFRHVKPDASGDAASGEANS